MGENGGRGGESLMGSERVMMEAAVTKATGAGVLGVPAAAAGRGQRAASVTFQEKGQGFPRAQ